MPEPLAGHPGHDLSDRVGGAADGRGPTHDLGDPTFVESRLFPIHRTDNITLGHETDQLPSEFRNGQAPDPTIDEEARGARIWPPRAKRVGVAPERGCRSDTPESTPVPEPALAGSRRPAPIRGAFMHAFYIASVFLHIAAAIVWIGGTFFLILVVVPWLRPGNRAAAGTMLRDTGIRFRAVGWWCFAVLFATGPFNLRRRRVSLADLTIADRLQTRSDARWLLRRGAPRHSRPGSRPGRRGGPPSPPRRLVARPPERPTRPRARLPRGRSRPWLAVVRPPSRGSRAPGSS